MISVAPSESVGVESVGIDGRVAPQAVRSLLVASQNGGVGRSLLAANLAVLAARTGKRVLLLDLDPCCGLSAALGWACTWPAPRGLGASGAAIYVEPLFHPVFAAVEGRSGVVDLWTAAAGEGCSTVPSDALQEALAAVRDEGRPPYDLVIVDGPAAAGAGLDDLLAVSHEVLLAVRAEPLGLRTLPELLKSIRRARERSVRCLGVVLTSPQREAPAGAAEATFRALLAGAPLLGTLPFDPRACEAALEGVPLVDLDPESPASRALEAIARRLGWPASTEASFSAAEAPVAFPSRIAAEAGRGAAAGAPPIPAARTAPEAAPEATPEEAPEPAWAPEAAPGLFFASAEDEAALAEDDRTWRQRIADGSMFAMMVLWAALGATAVLASLSMAGGVGGLK